MSKETLFSLGDLKPSKIFQLTALSAALALTGCGGSIDYFAPTGNGNSGSGSSTDNTGGSQATDPVDEDDGTVVVVGKDYSVYMTPSAPTIKMQKAQTVDVTVRVLDNKTNGIAAGIPVNFAITNPKLTGIFSNAAPVVTTDDKGQASITLEVASDLTDDQKTYLKDIGLDIIAEVDGGTPTNITVMGSEKAADTGSVITNDYNVYLTSSSKTIEMQRDSFIDVTVRVLQDSTNGVVADKEVKFIIPDPNLTGLFSNATPKVTTDETGQASVKLSIDDDLTAEQKAKLKEGIQIKAVIVGDDNTLVEMTVTGIEPKLGGDNDADDLEYKVYLTPSSDEIKMKRGEKITVTARVLESVTKGIAANKDVVFKIDDPALTGVFSDSTSNTVTDANGKVTLTLEIINALTEFQKTYLKDTGLKISANVGNHNDEITIMGTNSDVPAESPDYDVVVNKSNYKMKTGTDSVTLLVRVTDKKGGIVPNVPVDFQISDPHALGLSLDGLSSAVTNEKGVVEIDLLQSNSGINSQIEHIAKVGIDINGQRATSQEIEVKGTSVSNVVTSSRSLLTGEKITISGILNDGSSDPIHTEKYADAKLVLLTSDKVVGEAQSNSDGEFSFTDISQESLLKDGNQYKFDLRVFGVKDNDIGQPSETIKSIANVIAISQKDLSIDFEQNNINAATGEITMQKPDPQPDGIKQYKSSVVTIKANGKDGENVIVSTTKGGFTETLMSSEIDPPSTVMGTIQNGQAKFFFRPKVTGTTSIEAKLESDSDVIDSVEVYVSSVIPNKLLLQSVKSEMSTKSTTDVIATVLDAEDTPVANAYVAFSIDKDGSGGQLSQSLVKTNKYGKAVTSYTAGENPTANDKVIIKSSIFGVAIDGQIDQTKGSDVEDAVTELTVQTKSSTIALGLANKIINGPNSVYYFRNGSAFVTNNAGQPSANQEVSISLRPHGYFKGFKYYGTPYMPGAVDKARWYFTLGNPDRIPITTFFFDDVDGVYKADNQNPDGRLFGELGPMTYCENEDTNFNSILDPGEDFNGNGSLETGYRATLLINGDEVSQTGGVYKLKTDDKGKINFQVRYLKEDAQWMVMDLVASTKVDGSESIEKQRIGFPILIDDETSKTTPNRESPFGSSADCENPN